MSVIALVLFSIINVFRHIVINRSTGKRRLHLLIEKSRCILRKIVYRSTGNLAQRILYYVREQNGVKFPFLLFSFFLKNIISDFFS